MIEAGLTLGDIADHYPDPVLLVDRGANCLDANTAARAALGISERGVRGICLLNLVDGERREFKNYLALCSASLQMLPGSVRLSTNAGTTLYRCYGSALEPAGENGQTSIVLCLTRHERASMRFRLLSERVDDLGRQVALRMRAESLLDGQRGVLELIAEERPQGDILDALARLIENETRNNARASILVLDRSTGRLHHGAAPSLPESYCKAIDGVEIGPSVGSCGTAAFLNETVFATDIASDARWAGYRELAAAAGLHACLSTPICGRNNTVLGTFALYYSEPQEEAVEDIGLLAHLARTAGIALERAESTAEISRLLECERQARAEAEEANRAKDEFLAMVSHELRNPLNAIVGWASLLDASGTEPATLAEGIDAIQRNAALQARLINEILDYARVRAGKLRLEIEPTDFVALTRSTIESARPAAEGAKLTLTFDIRTTRSLIVHVDPRRMQQVLSNLLSNAVKFTPEGGTVAVSLSSADGELKVAVSDTGCGIQPEFLPHVFERFRQQDASKHRRHDGLGIGLAIVKEVVDLHGGRVVARSDGPNRGATFEFFLPLHHARRTARHNERNGSPDLSRVRVLAVDDLPDARALVRTMFQSIGASVVVAATGAEALEHIRKDRPTVFLCDIGMPVMDGFEVIRRLRADERQNRLPRLPAVAITAYASNKDRQQALEAGFDAHMAKPIDARELMWLIADLVAADKSAD